jgi:HSP20 family protein
MAVTRWNPWGDVFALTDTVDQLFNRTSPRGDRGTLTQSLPLDIRQTDEAFVIEASVPGFRPDEVDITIDENVLTIKAHREQETGSEKGGYVRRERRVTSFFRQVGLPAEVRAEEINASFENGLLTITVPRAQKAQPRRIQVNGGGAAQPTLVESSAEQPTS